MKIKHFSMFHRRVPDPMRPGRTAAVGVLRPSGSTSLGHGDRVYEADEKGWFDVPHEVGIELCKFRQAGSGFFTEAEVEEEHRLGNVEPEPQPVRRSSRAS